MSLAGAKWKTMSDEAKAVFNAKAAAAAPAVASGGAGVLALPPSGAGGSGDGGEKKKKKKKKRDHEGSDEHKASFGAREGAGLAGGVARLVSFTHSIHLTSAHFPLFPWSLPKPTEA